MSEILIDKHKSKMRFEDGIYKFTPDLSYSTGNFEMLRKLHPSLQIDSKIESSFRMNDILSRTNWTKDFFRGKKILECGCGAGGDTEILATLGSEVVAVDIAGLDVAKKNLENFDNIHFVQASITNLPFLMKSFDIVYCSRVIQHTPNPVLTLNHIMKFVRNGGGFYMNCYARTFTQMLRWKYFLRPFTTKMNSDKLYQLIRDNGKNLYALTKSLKRMGKIGRTISWVFVPFLNYSDSKDFGIQSDIFFFEYGVHDTFDALSPKYDNPMGAQVIGDIAEKNLKNNFEVIDHKTTAMLRTLI